MEYLESNVKVIKSQIKENKTYMERKETCKFPSELLRISHNFDSSPPKSRKEKGEEKIDFYLLCI